MKIYAKHLPYDDGHLGQVIEDMRHLGPPTIRAVDFNGRICAIEGSHRLAAAHYLGLIPKILVEPTTPNELESWWGRVIETLPKYEFSVM